MSALNSRLRRNAGEAGRQILHRVAGIEDRPFMRGESGHGRSPMIRKRPAKIEIIFKDDDVLRSRVLGLLQDGEVAQKATPGTDRREAGRLLRANGRKELCAPSNP